MKRVYNKKGLTLVEIVLSIAIFGIMLVCFLNVFLGSYAITMRAEAKTNTTAFVAGEIDKKIASNAISTITSTAIINYSQGITTSVPVKTFSVNATNDKGQTVLMTYVAPVVTP